MPEYLRPDVFAERLPAQIQPIEGVGTTVGAFVGVAERGPIDQPTLIESWPAYVRTFGNFYQPARDEDSYLSEAVRGFFANGGKICYVCRVAHRDGTGASTAVAASAAANDEQGSPVLSLTIAAKYPGVYGARLGYQIRHNPKCSTTLAANALSTATILTLTSLYGVQPGSELKISNSAGTGAYVRVKRVIPETKQIELTAQIGAVRANGDPVVSEEFDVLVYEDNAIQETWLQLNIWSAYLTPNKNFVESVINDPSFGSQHIKVTFNTANTAIYRRHPNVTTSVVLLAGGNDGLTSFDTDDVIGDESIPSGLQAMLGLDDINMIALPGFGGAAIVDALSTFVGNQRKDVFAFTAGASGATPTEVMTYRQNTPGFDTEDLSLYYPWIQVRDPIGVGDDARLWVPPEGHVMGMRVRMDLARGIFHGGFGYEATLSEALDVQFKVSDPIHDLLDPKNINAIRSKLGRGIAVWGGDTVSPLPEYRFQSVVRTLMFFEESIQDSLGWALGYPSDQRLWERLRVNISAFLHARWLDGYLQGATPQEAFYVNTEDSALPANIAIGKVVVNVGVAIVRPAKYLVLRFIQHSGNQSVERLGLAA